MTASSQLEVCWYRVEYDGEGRPRARHEPTLGRRPGPALARFLRNAKLSRGSIGVDYIINGLSLTDRLNDTCKRPLFDVPGFLANMLPIYWQWRGDDQRGFALELRRLLGEPLTPDDLQPVAQAYKWLEEAERLHPHLRCCTITNRSVPAVTQVPTHCGAGAGVYPRFPERLVAFGVHTSNTSPRAGDRRSASVIAW